MSSLYFASVASGWTHTLRQPPETAGTTNAMTARNSLRFIFEPQPCRPDRALPVWLYAAGPVFPHGEVRAGSSALRPARDRRRDSVAVVDVEFDKRSTPPQGDWRAYAAGRLYPHTRGSNHLRQLSRHWKRSPHGQALRRLHGNGRAVRATAHRDYALRNGARGSLDSADLNHSEPVRRSATRRLRSTADSNGHSNPRDPDRTHGTRQRGGLERDQGALRPQSCEDRTNQRSTEAVLGVPDGSRHRGEQRSLIERSGASDRANEALPNRDRERLVAQLDTYYRRHGIHPLAFACPHRASCSAGCRNFTEARASLIGHRYGDPIRVVVLSLDPGAGWPNPNDRTFEGVVARVARDDPDRLPKHKHWYRTYETVAALLSCFSGERVEPRDAAGRFAHVNAAKCSHNLPHNGQAPARVFRNCRAFLQEELTMLAPDIVVTQGQRAAKVVAPWVRSGRKNVLEICSHGAYWLELVHPTAWGGAYGEERKTWPRRFRRARRWVET